MELREMELRKENCRNKIKKGKMNEENNIRDRNARNNRHARHDSLREKGASGVHKSD